MDKTLFIDVMHFRNLKD